MTMRHKATFAPRSGRGSDSELAVLRREILAEKALASIRSLRKSLGAAPTIADRWNDIGVAHAKRGEHAKAIRCFERAIAREQHHLNAHGNLGISYMVLGDLDKAKKLFETAFCICPHDPLVHHNFAMLNLELGKTRLALFNLANATTHAANNPAALRRFAKDFLMVYDAVSETRMLRGEQPLLSGELITKLMEAVASEAPSGSSNDQLRAAALSVSGEIIKIRDVLLERQ